MRQSIDSIDERLAILKKIENLVLKNRELWVSKLKQDLGRHEAETEIVEVFPVVSELKSLQKNLRAWAKPRSVETPLALFGYRSEIRIEPKGRVLVIAPWNYPFCLSMQPAASAIAAGNRVVIKPSELSPATAAAIFDVFNEAFPEGEVSVKLGGADVSQDLISQGFDHVFFTGSSKVGAVVMEQAAKKLSPVTLELGGKSPAIITEDVDLDLAALKIAWGKIINCGQTCVAPDYVLVPHRHVSSFVELLRTQLGKFYSENDTARIVNSSHASRLRSILEDAKAQGAQWLAVAESDGEKESQNMVPTIVLGATEKMRIMQEEVFGPILPVIGYSSYDEIKKWACEIHPNPLALYVFGKNQSEIDAILNAVPSGGACVNETILHVGNHHLPFGGIGRSGMGASHGYAGFRSFSHERSVLRRGLFSGIAFFYPPYTARVKKLAQWLTRYFS